MRLRRVVKIVSIVLAVALMSVTAFGQRDSRAERRKKREKALACWKRGDARRKRKKYEDAKADYEKSAELWQSLGNRNWANVTRQMVDLCEKMPKLDLKKLKDGDYQGTARGHSADISVAVRLKGGRIHRFAVTGNRESRPLKSMEILGGLVRRKQSPSVDAVSGATVTSYGVMAAALRALEKAKPDDAEE